MGVVVSGDAAAVERVTSRASTRPSMRVSR
jgi:hypothetical protein